VERWIAGALVLGLVALYQVLGAAMVRSQDRVMQQGAGARLADLLEGVAADVPIVQVGQSSCEYSLSFHAHGRDVWQLIPPTTEGTAPLLRALDERTVEVQAGEDRTLAFFTEVSQDPRGRRRRMVPSLLTAGSQGLGLATAHSPERSGNAVTAFRLTFDRPLRAYVFVRVSGCVALERWAPDTAPR
jgi:hypothetical protein